MFHILQLSYLSAVVLSLTCLGHLGVTAVDTQDEDVFPSVFIVMLVRNKAHVLPFTLAYLENQDYPKHRISIWIRSDHNEDDTTKMLLAWRDKWSSKSHPDTYHSIEVVDMNSGKRFPDQLKGPLEWSKERFAHVMNLREEGIFAARKAWADWVWQLDGDVFLTNSGTLKSMAFKTDEVVVAPVLKSLGRYSNFWGGMTNEFYYNRTDIYDKILKRQSLGCHSVPMVHSCVLINMRKKVARLLSFQHQNLAIENVPFDDIISFALSAKANNISLMACNEEEYGYIMLPLEDNSQLMDDVPNLSNIKLDILAYTGPMMYLDYLSEYVPTPKPNENTLGVDKVYLINLERRPDRLAKMKAILAEIGVEFQLIKAVDGKKDVNENFIDELGIVMMPEFKEPYHGRAITFGEIGCFMSHYNTWLDIVKSQHDSVIVLEDDVRFEPFFLAKIDELHKHIENLKLDWDLIFLGRKILKDYDESWVNNSNLLVHVNYTYWTLGYMLSNRGAQKLLNEKPLSKIVPVDEYLPIMYDRHPNDKWKSFFHQRNLQAFSVHPQFIFPTHYTGEPGYLSDTEDSKTMCVQNCNPKPDQTSSHEEL